MNASPLLTEGLPSRLGLRIGWMLSALVIVFLLFDGAIQLVPLPVANQTLVSLGYADSDALSRGIGGLTLACALLYAWPRISLLGAILMTGLMVGAMATHLRAGSPVFSHVLFGFYVGALAWLGLRLRVPWLYARRCPEGSLR
jgi:hypothetical protein